MINRLSECPEKKRKMNSVLHLLIIALAGILFKESE